MNRRLIVVLSFLIVLSSAVVAQDKMGGAKPTEKDKTEAIPANAYLKRGAPIGSSEKIELSKALQDPNKYAGKSILVEGVIVRSCKMEGCWAELAPNKEAKGVRVTFKGHAFFIRFSPPTQPHEPKVYSRSRP